MIKKCKICNKKIVGRGDKIFCSITCKNKYHIKLRQVNTKFTNKIDIILHRNRSILLEVLGKNSSKKKLPRIILDNKKFNFNYLTSFHINSQGKTVHHVYDFSWLVFSDDEVLIQRKKTI